jgi:hypothetical protein
MIWPDNRKYKGEFFSGKPCGAGIKFNKEGQGTKGYWVGGRFFVGEAAENVLEAEMKKLIKAKKDYFEMKKREEELLRKAKLKALNRGKSKGIKDDPIKEKDSKTKKSVSKSKKRKGDEVSKSIHGDKRGNPLALRKK